TVHVSVGLVGRLSSGMRKPEEPLERSQLCFAHEKGKIQSDSDETLRKSILDRAGGVSPTPGAVSAELRVPGRLGRVRRGLVRFFFRIVLLAVD
ncbi:hypothetical protein B8W95_13100, partial [Staphylococcus pasteuri]